MKKDINKILESYRFQDDKKMIVTTIVVHFIFLAIFLMVDWTNLLSDLRTQICLFIGISYMALYKYYNWRSTNINVLIMLFYLFLIIFELIYCGIPNSPLSVGNNISKGIIFEVLISTIPYIYLFLKIGVIFPLIKIIFSSRSIDKPISR